MRGIHFIMKGVRALPAPDFAGSVNAWKMRQIDKLQARIADALKQGDHFLIYPSGRLKDSEQESIGGASLVSQLLNRVPKSHVVLVRTLGLWGSLFSKAPTGSSPDFAKTLLRGLGILLKNGLFFTPRREVTITFSHVPNDFPEGASKQELNAYLERWYNEPPDVLKRVPFYFWKNEVAPYFSPKEHPSDFSIAIPQEIERAVFQEVARVSKRNQSDLHKEMRLSQDLGFDSLDIAEFILFLEIHFAVGQIAPSQLQTIQDIMVLAAKGNSSEHKPEKTSFQKVGSDWYQEDDRPESLHPEGKSLQEAFLRICDRFEKRPACADSLSGVLSYRRLKMAALILSEKIREMPGHHIGVMLPASVVTYTVILAILLAKKIPVMLNWTVGTRALEHAVTIAQVDTILSSYRFLSRLSSGDMGKADDKILFLEEIRRTISLSQLIKGWRDSLIKSPKLLKKLHLHDVTGEQIGVILFTSGTETLPKGVPLTHDNLLSNQRAALSAIDVRPSDIFFGCLPPFHSFGFSATGLLPILSGMKVCFSPDPTDGHVLASEIAHWKPTLLCAAPGFISGIFRSARGDQLKSVRLFVSGAEKTPQALFDHVAALGTSAQLLEGYGITECSPVVTLERGILPHKGVGQPLPGVELMVIHPETGLPLAQGQEGEICIAGPSVFKGYLSNPEIHPFIEMNHKKWYRSGDRGIIDETGTLILLGRLKRFVKIGGEMVSLGGLEQDIAEIAKEKNWYNPGVEGPQCALIAASGSDQDKVSLVLFTVFPTTAEEINLALRQKGVGSLAKISAVKHTDQIPLTGTGKTHYRSLEELWKQNHS
jgi:long-chain-fatty-acid--[acyl-carrier-protein] ligase